MTLQLQNLKEAKSKLASCDVSLFANAQNSFPQFLSKIEVASFRHLSNLAIEFTSPVTVIAGTNKIGKTSLLLLIACSYEKFLKADSTSPQGQFREHNWSDVLAFTSHENQTADYSYKLWWRVANNNHEGEGKRLSSSRAWSGLAKKSSDSSRINAKIRNREVRFIDLERVLPSRSFTNALLRKTINTAPVRLNEEVEQAFAYIFELPQIEIRELGTHINKSCFLVSPAGDSYSSYNAATGEEAAIYLLRDIIDAPKNSLILIDELEAGFHPSVQRRMADVIQYVSWRDKKQFILTSHSGTLISALPPESRRFIERKSDGTLRTINKVSQQAARSKMDAIGHALFRAYCEDELAKFLLGKVLTKIAAEKPHYDRLVNVITSGAANDVRTDYNRHKRNFTQYRNKVGYCAVFDGDHKELDGYSHFFENPEELAAFIYPYEAPEKFLVRAYLAESPNAALLAALTHSQHHMLFQEMCNLGLATDPSDARNTCYAAFERSTEFAKHYADLKAFLWKVTETFSESDPP